MILRLQRLRLWWETAFWVIPFAGIVGAFVMATFTEQLDETLRDVRLTILSPSSAQTLLAAIGGGMVTFTGFVFSVILLVIQYGSSTYSPRTVTYFMRARTTRWALAAFLGTITFSFVALFDIGSAGAESFVPVISVVTAVAALLISMVWFLARRGPGRLAGRGPSGPQWIPVKVRASTSSLSYRPKQVDTKEKP